MNKTDWKRIGTLGVDSGQMMLVDPCYALADKQELENILLHEQINTYDKLLEEYGDDFNVDTIEFADGIVCSTGYGDGSYDVFIKTIDDSMWGHRVAEMKIVFIEDEPEHEECEACGYTEDECCCDVLHEGDYCPYGCGQFESECDGYCQEEADNGTE